MTFIAELLQSNDGSVSYVRAAILREDSERLARLDQIFEQNPDQADFIKNGLYNQWTNGDFRTHEIKAEVEGLLKAYHCFLAGDRTETLEKGVREAWQAFDKARLNVLVGC